MRWLFIILLGLQTASAVTLEWDPSPDAWVNGYRIYCGTNSVFVHGLTNAPVRVDCGTNTTCTISNLSAGTFYFVATAYTADGAESLPSNEVVWRVPAAPQNTRTVVVQWSSAVASTNWQDIGFFKIKLGH